MKRKACEEGRPYKYQREGEEEEKLIKQVGKRRSILGRGNQAEKYQKTQEIDERKKKSRR